jgi:DNA-binding GntR family transcriptional regulator
MQILLVTLRDGMARSKAAANGMAGAVAHAPARARAPALGEDEIFARIHQAVLDHRLQPGTKLKEVALAETFGVNRAVIRRVLARLSYHRLVALRPNRAAVVASPSVDESRDIFAARRVVEAAIVDRVARSASLAAAKTLQAHVRHEQETYARGDARRGLKLSLAFHRELATLGGNGVLAEFLDQLMARTPLVVLAHRAPGGGNACSDGEHAAIVEAIARGDADAAVDAMTAHLAALESQLDLTDKIAEAPDLATLFTAPEA